MCRLNIFFSNSRVLSSRLVENPPAFAKYLREKGFEGRGMKERKEWKERESESESEREREGNIVRHYLIAPLYLYRMCTVVTVI